MKITLTVLILLISFWVFAPEYRDIILAEGVRIDPYVKLKYAVGMVESRNDDSAVNLSEMAFGRYQIRPIRLQDYFERTGIRYSLNDMKDSVKSVTVFMYYAHRIGINNLDKICLDWNCQSYAYLAKVKKYIN